MEIISLIQPPAISSCPYLLQLRIAILNQLLFPLLCIIYSIYEVIASGPRTISQLQNIEIIAAVLILPRALVALVAKFEHVAQIPPTGTTILNVLQADIEHHVMHRGLLLVTSAINGGRIPIEKAP